MCGIAGIWSRCLDVPAIAESMALKLAHRGPDDSGCWSDTETGIALAHRRLSVVDLSRAGHQPMISDGGRYVLTFNGEIYNHAELRRRLVARCGSPEWRGQSDTETLLAAIEAWGVRTALESTVGMFAFALWDRQERSLTLARDRVGEKPLYYGRVSGGIAFASELKALKVIPGFCRDIDRTALALFMRHSYVPSPYSIYKGVGKLPPGSFLTVPESSLSQIDPIQSLPYWSANDVAIGGRSNPSLYSNPADAGDALEHALRESIRGQMLADVPLGAFLSGGVDSSTVVALMQAEAQAHGWAPVRTFSIGFTEDSYNEATHARAVALHLGTDHAEHIATGREALDIIPSLATLYDEPFADPSQIPTFLLSRFARQSVTVALSGDGGDELFGGYYRHALAAGNWPSLERTPRVLRRFLGNLIRLVPPSGWDSIYRALKSVIPPTYRLSQPGDRMHKAAMVLRASDGKALYSALVTHWENIAAGVAPPASLLDSQWPALPELVSQMMLMDLKTYLPDDILVKVDRAAMGVSLEVRVPFLDHRLIEFAWRLPLEYKLRGGVGKWLLRQVLYRHVPRELVDRPKSGFAVPIDAWLRGPLKEWAHALLDDSALRQQGFFDADRIGAAWREHLSGRRNWAYHLWDVLMFQAWLEQAE